MIRLPCGNCGQELQVPDSAAGKRMRCPRCATTATVPANPVLANHVVDAEFDPAPNPPVAQLVTEPADNPPATNSPHLPPMAQLVTEPNPPELDLIAEDSDPALPIKPKKIKDKKTRPKKKRRRRDDDDDAPGRNWAPLIGYGLLALWGLGIIIYSFARQTPAGASGAYKAGQTFGTLLGIAFLIIGSIKFVQRLNSD